ncbi:hypothetical protein BH10ACT1_BH10ACT1_37780 [soil metagenome]
MTHVAGTEAAADEAEVEAPAPRSGSAPGRRARRESLPGRWSGAHLPALDGLRGLAVAGVLAFHDRRLEGGWLGVDLFFTLSGFLITSLLVAEVHRSSGVALGRFWQRRARRLLPAFVALVAVLVAWSTFSDDTPWATADVRGASLAALAYVANWYQAFAAGGYWNRFAAPSPLQHAWSLAIEEQFYLVFPLVVWACARLSRRPVRLLLVVCAAGWSASLAATLVMGAGAGNTNRVYLGTDTRVGSVLLGCMLACVLAIIPKRTDPGAEPDAEADVVAPSRRRSPSTVMADGAALGAVVILAVLWSKVDGAGSFGLRGGLSLHAALVCVVIAVVVRVPGSVVARALAWRPLVWLGTISYGLYLWHWPVFLYVDLEVHLGSRAETLVKVSVSLALAVASLVLVERPLRRGGAAVMGGLVPTVAVVAVVVLGAALVPAPRSIPGDQLADAPRSIDELDALPAIGGGAATSSTGPTTTAPPTKDVPDLEAGAPAADGTTSVLERPGRVAGPTRLLVVGDSVPYLLTRALVPVQDQFGLVVANRGLPACSAADPEAERRSGAQLPVPPDCLGRWIDDAAAFDPDLVVLSLNGDVGVELRYDGTWGGTCTDGYQQRLGERLRDGLATVTGRGARVFVFSPLIAQVPFYRPEGVAESRRCLTDLERRIAQEVPGVSTVGFGEWVCPEVDEECRTSLDGNPVDRPDGVHFTGNSALVVWRLVLPEMLKAAGAA